MPTEEEKNLGKHNFKLIILLFLDNFSFCSSKSTFTPNLLNLITMGSPYAIMSHAPTAIIDHGLKIKSTEACIYLAFYTFGCSTHNFLGNEVKKRLSVYFSAITPQSESNKQATIKHKLFRAG